MVWVGKRRDEYFVNMIAKYDIVLATICTIKKKSTNTKKNHKIRKRLSLFVPKIGVRT